MAQQTSGRKSLFSYNNNEFQFEHGYNASSFLELDALIVEICGAHNPTSRFIENEEFNFGVKFIVYCLNDKNIYVVNWDESYDCLRFIYGQDSNILGRKVKLYPKEFTKQDILYCKFSFSKVHENKYPDEATLNVISGRAIGGIPMDYTSSIRAYEINPSDGDGEEWSIIK